MIRTLIVPNYDIPHILDVIGALIWIVLTGDFATKWDRDITSIVVILDAHRSAFTAWRHLTAHDG